jgi:secreted PhoX family phosphatase
MAQDRRRADADFQSAGNFIEPSSLCRLPVMIAGDNRGHPIPQVRSREPPGMTTFNRFKDDNIPSNPSTAPTMDAVIEARLSRRGVMKGLATTAVVAGAATAGLFGSTALGTAARAAAPRSTLTFKELPHGYDATFHVAEGHDATVLIRWGDPVEAGAPAFDPLHQTAAAQSKQFGYNNDFIGFQPLPRGSSESAHGLLCVNHEYTNTELMFPGLTAEDAMDKLTKDQADIELAAHGHSVIEIKRVDGAWQVVKDSPYNRRITALATEMELSGPAAGHDRLKTSADASGRKVVGTLNNCAGGTTPWGTVLIAEENFHQYFGGDPAKTAEAGNYKRYGIKGEPTYAWHKFHDRFDVEKEPNEPNRFGWMVELDPFDPTSTPKKRTALGRFKHEGATIAVTADGTVVAYSGDDERFDYIYRFVAARKFNAADLDANRDILDEGTLSVGRFDADGSLTWMPLVHGQGPLTAANGFDSQADVLIETRRAADLLGATPMDRPEDVEPNPVTGTVYVMLTNNTKRKDDQVDAANPRAKNKHGHVLEMIPPGGRGAKADHAADTFTWDILLRAGNPRDAADNAAYGEGVSADGWLSCPDNCAFDSQGRLWIATDGAPKSGFADGVWATDVEGGGRAVTRHFLRTPVGAELCGPTFNPDDTAFFCAVQHPGDEKGATFANPATRWPDFRDDLPTRPSVVVITRQDGGTIG